jgi:hypothetical protein
VALPTGLWSLRLIGQYVRADGTPHRGFITLTPEPASVTALPGGTPITITLQAARLDIDADGFVSGTLLNPNDPTIKPGPGTDEKWRYCVRETFQRGPVIGWWLDVPDTLGDGAFLDLNMMDRNCEDIVRPVDWFPHHLIDTPVQASRISPRSGPLMREVN